MRKRSDVGSKTKAQAALEAVREMQPLSQIARRYGIHAIQLGMWRKRLLSNAHQVFEEGGVVNGAEHDREIQELYEQIGRLKVENDFLKKIWCQPFEFLLHALR